MIIYNVTVKVEVAISDEWEQWLLEEHAPGMLATGCFIKYHLVRILEVDDSEGPTYAVQYYMADLQHYRQYIRSFAPLLQKSAAAKWGQQFIDFSTLMQVIR